MSSYFDIKLFPKPQTFLWFDEADNKYGWWARQHHSFIQKRVRNYGCSYKRHLKDVSREFPVLMECTWTYVWFIWKIWIQYLCNSMLMPSKWWGIWPKAGAGEVWTTMLNDFVHDKRYTGKICGGEHKCFPQFQTFLPDAFIFAYIEIQHFKRVVEDIYDLYIPWWICYEIISLTLIEAFVWRFDCDKLKMQWRVHDKWITALPIPQVRWVFSPHYPKQKMMEYPRESVKFGKFSGYYSYGLYWIPLGKYVWFLNKDILWIIGENLLLTRDLLWQEWLQSFKVKSLSLHGYFPSRHYWRMFRMQFMWNLSDLTEDSDDFPEDLRMGWNEPLNWEDKLKLNCEVWPEETMGQEEIQCQYEQELLFQWHYQSDHSEFRLQENMEQEEKEEEEELWPHEYFKHKEAAQEE